MKIHTARLLLVLCWLGLLLAACGGAPQPAAAPPPATAPTAEGPVQRGAAGAAVDISCNEPYKSSMKPISSLATKQEQADIVAKHNAERKVPLVWDDTLAAFAQGWANGLEEYTKQNTRDVLLLGAHSSLTNGSPTCYAKNNGGAGYGENIGTTEGFLAEKADWHPDTGKCTGDKGGQPGQCGHYLQAVASWVKKVGCGKTPTGGWVCNYDTYGGKLTGGRYFDPFGDGKQPFACNTKALEDLAAKQQNAGKRLTLDCNVVESPVAYINGGNFPLASQLTVIAIPRANSNVSIEVKYQDGKIVATAPGGGEGKAVVLTHAVIKDGSYRVTVKEVNGKPFAFDVAVYQYISPAAAAAANPTIADFKVGQQVAIWGQVGGGYDFILGTIKRINGNTASVQVGNSIYSDIKPGVQSLLTLEQAEALKIKVIGKDNAAAAAPAPAAQPATTEFKVGDQVAYQDKSGWYKATLTKVETIAGGKIVVSVEYIDANGKKLSGTAVAGASNLLTLKQAEDKKLTFVSQPAAPAPGNNNAGSQGVGGCEAVNAYAKAKNAGAIQEWLYKCATTLTVEAKGSVSGGVLINGQHFDNQALSIVAVPKNCDIKIQVQVLADGGTPTGEVFNADESKQGGSEIVTLTGRKGLWYSVTFIEQSGQKGTINWAPFKK